jgi:two-component system, response regulator YesN
MEKLIWKKKIFKRKLYYSYLVSYLVIGIFPMILSLWGYTSSVKIINDEIKTSQSYILEQLKITFDNYMETAIRINESLADNEQLIRLAEVSDYSSKDHLDAKMMRDELKAMMSNLDFCSDIVLYFNNSDSFITASKRYSADTADRYTLNYGLNKEGFIKMVDIRGLRGYRIIQDKQGNNSILFIENVLNYNYKNKEAVIIFVLPWNKVKEMTFPIRDGKIFWLNENNDLLIANDNNINMTDLTYDDYKSEGDLLYSGQGKDREISSFRKALNYNIKYCVTMSEKNTLKNPVNLR